MELPDQGREMAKVYLPDNPDRRWLTGASNRFPDPSRRPSKRRKNSATAWRTRHIHVPAVFADDAGNDSQPEAGADTDGLGGEERVKDTPDDFLGDARAVVGNLLAGCVGRQSAWCGCEWSRDDPRPQRPRRVVPHVLPVPTLQVRDPVEPLVLMKAGDLPLHCGQASRSSARAPITSRAARTPEARAPCIQPGWSEVCSPAKRRRPSVRPMRGRRERIWPGLNQV